jgi:hypothetical protein
MGAEPQRSYVASKPSERHSGVCPLLGMVSGRAAEQAGVAALDRRGDLSRHEMAPARWTKALESIGRVCRGSESRATDEVGVTELGDDGHEGQSALDKEEADRLYGLPGGTGRGATKAGEASAEISKRKHRDHLRLFGQPHAGVRGAGRHPARPFGDVGSMKNMMKGTVKWVLRSSGVNVDLPASGLWLRGAPVNVHPYAR